MHLFFSTAIKSVEQPHNRLVELLFQNNNKTTKNFDRKQWHFRAAKSSILRFHQRKKFKKNKYRGDGGNKTTKKKKLNRCRCRKESAGVLNLFFLCSSFRLQKYNATCRILIKETKNILVHGRDNYANKKHAFAIKDWKMILHLFRL